MALSGRGRGYEPETDFTVFDPEAQTKWFIMAVTGGTLPEDAKVARLQGPCGLEKDKQQTPIVLSIGAATYQELPGDGPEESVDEDDSAWASWPNDQPYIQKKWQISRSVVGTNTRGRAEAKADVIFLGSTRISDGGDTPEILRSSRCSSTSYTVQLGGKPKKVEGGRFGIPTPAEPAEDPAKDMGKGGDSPSKDTSQLTFKEIMKLKEEGKSPHSSPWQSPQENTKTPKEPKSDDSLAHFEGTWELDGGVMSVECFFQKQERRANVKVAESCPPLGALCLGIAMQRWLHPLAAEEFAETRSLCSPSNTPACTPVLQMRGN